MSAKRRSVVPESPATNVSYPVYDLDTALGAVPAGGVANSSDPIAALEAEETMNTIKELRELQLRKKRNQLLKRVEKEKQEIEMGLDDDGTWSAKNLPNLSAQDIAMVSKMTPEDQQKFMQAYQLLNSLKAVQMPRGQQNPILTMMMATGGLGGGQKGLGVQDVMQIANMFNGIYNGAGRGDTDTTKQLLLNLMTNTLPQWQNSAIQNMQMAYQAQIAQLQQNQADPLRDLEYGKKLAESLGFKPTTASADVEKLRIDMEDRWKLKEFELKANQMQYERQMGLVNQILNNPLVTQLAAMFSRGVGSVVAAQTQIPQSNALSQENAVTQQSPQGAPQPKQQATLIKYICPSCNNDIIAPATQNLVTCTNCGATFQVDPNAAVKNAMRGP